MTYIPAKRRQKAATVHVGGKDKFPIDSAKTARSALKLEGHAKPPLTSGQKQAIARKAAKYGVHPSSTATKKKSS